MPASSSVSVCAHNPHTTIGEDVRRLLTLTTGRGRRFAVKDLALASGVGTDRIEKAKLPLENESYRALGADAIFSVIAVIAAEMGPEPVAPLFARLGLGVFALPDPDDGSPLKEIVPDVAGASAELTSGAIEGGNVIDFQALGGRLMRHGAALKALDRRRTGQGELFGGGRAA